MGLTWPLSLSYLTGTSLTRILYLGLCFSQHSIIFYQDNRKLKWSWTIHHIHNQPNFCWITFAKAHIKPSLTHWIPFKGFHSRLLNPWLQNIYGANFPNSLYTILYIRDPTLDTYFIVHFRCPKSMDNAPLWHIIQDCINMELHIVTIVLMVLSAYPFWCKALALLNLIFCCFLKSSSINFEVLKISLSGWYTFIITPWLLSSFSKWVFTL